MFPLRICSEAMAAVDKPFRAEYSKSDRATCRHCTVFIAKDTLRYAQLVRVSRGIRALEATPLADRTSGVRNELMPTWVWGVRAAVASLRWR